MTFLYEHEGKNIFSEFNVPIPNGFVASSPTEAKTQAQEIGFPVTVKAQIKGGRRGKVGAIKFAENNQELEQAATKLFKRKVHGQEVRKILIEEKIGIKEEYYLSLMLDFEKRKPVLIFSPEGGVEIEEIAEKKPASIIKKWIPVETGLKDFMVREVLNSAGIYGKELRKFSKFFQPLWKAFKRRELLLAEINPLVESKDGEIMAVDARIIADDNAMFRQEWLKGIKTKRHGKESLEYKAEKQGIDFVILDGDIGIVGNGAGLTMATCDVVQEFGGKPANFLDVGGGAGPKRVAAAVRLIKSLEEVKVYLINIFGGITKCDDVAQGIIKAREKVGLETPLVVRLTGTNEKKGKEMLKEEGIHAYGDMTKAVKKALAVGGK